MTPSPPVPSFAERGDEKIDFKELTQARYSLRKFDPRPIEEEKLRLLLQAATGKNAGFVNVHYNNSKSTKST